MADRELCEITPEHLRIREELTVLDLAEQIGIKHLEETAECIALSDEVSKLKEAEFAKLPFHLNLLATVANRGLKENAHSKLLWKLLQRSDILE